MGTLKKWITKKRRILIINKGFSQMMQMHSLLTMKIKKKHSKEESKKNKARMKVNGENMINKTNNNKISEYSVLKD